MICGGFDSLALTSTTISFLIFLAVHVLLTITENERTIYDDLTTTDYEIAERILMAFEATIASALSFTVMSFLLLVYSVLDARDRRVPNIYMLVGIVVSAAIVIGTGRFFEQSLLHATAILVMILLSFVLYRIGAIGGADAKALLQIGILSPGIEFAAWTDMVLEGVLISGLEIALMLALGILYWRLKGTRTQEKNSVPLIPFLLLAYFAVQLLAFL